VIVRSVNTARGLPSPATSLRASAFQWEYAVRDSGGAHAAPRPPVIFINVERTAPNNRPRWKASEARGWMRNTSSTALEVDDAQSSAAQPVGPADVANKLYAMSRNGGDVPLLEVAFDAVEARIAKGEFEFLDALLQQLDPALLRPIVSLGLARATSRIRERLPSWKGFVVRVYLSLSRTQDDASHRMRGLLNVNDPTLFAAERSAS
jgi:hypothetical protein